MTSGGVAYYGQTDRRTDRHHNWVTYCVFRLYRRRHKKIGTDPPKIASLPANLKFLLTVVNLNTVVYLELLD